MRMKLCDPYCRIKIIEYAVILLLMAIAVCALLVAIMSLAISHSFDDYPMFNAQYVFTVRNIEQHDGDSPLFFAKKKNKTSTNKLGRSETNGNFSTGSVTESVEKTNNSGFSDQDHLFLTTMTVDLVHTQWGPLALRNYIIFHPCIMEVAAIIWATLLIIFRTDRTGRTISKPWILVIPSIIFFVILSLLSFIYMIVIYTVWYQFCEDLQAQMVDKTIDCLMIAHAVQPHVDDLPFDLQLHVAIFKSCTDAGAFLSITCLAIMLLRCIFAVDFQLIHVTVSYLPPKNADERGELKNIFSVKSLPKPKPDDLVTVRFADKPNAMVKMMSQERGSEEDFHSAHSVLTVYSTNEDEHPSLEPLIKNEKIRFQTEV